MRNFRLVDKLCKEKRFDHIVCYIEEAHARDKWSCYSFVDFDAPVTQEARGSLALRLVEASKTRPELCLVDLVGEELMERAFAAFPERLYVVDELGTVVFRGGVGPDHYIDGFEQFMSTFANQSMCKGGEQL